MPKYRSKYTIEFKLQILKLFMQGKTRANICREYDLRPSTLNNWISNFRNFGSYSIVDNRIEDIVANYLRKEIVRLDEEIKILNQVVFILSRK